MPSRDETQQMIEEESSHLQTQIETIEYECDTRNIGDLWEQLGDLSAKSAEMTHIAELEYRFKNMLTAFTNIRSKTTF